VSEVDINANASGAIADRGGFGLNDLLGRKAGLLLVIGVMDAVKEASNKRFDVVCLHPDECKCNEEAEKSNLTRVRFDVPVHKVADLHECNHSDPLGSCGLTLELSRPVTRWSGAENDGAAIHLNGAPIRVRLE
jgi:hypothetical protein